MTGSPGLSPSNTTFLEENLLNTLESIIGDNDSAIIKLRIDLAFEMMEFEEEK